MSSAETNKNEFANEIDQSRHYLNPSAAAVSMIFSEIISSRLTPDQLSEVQRLNAAEQNRMVCHSHGFCDANEIMLESMMTMGIDPLPMDQTTMSDQMVALWNAAWSISRATGFRTAAIVIH